MKPYQSGRTELKKRPHALKPYNPLCSLKSSVQVGFTSRYETQTEKTFSVFIAMKLIDSELLELAKKYGNQDNARDPVVIAKYISTTSPAVWLVTDFDPETGEAVAYKAGIGDDGWDLFNLIELSQLRIPTTTKYYDAASKRETVRKSFGRVIRDAVFTPRRLSEVMPETPIKDDSPRFRMSDLQEIFGKKPESEKAQAQVTT